ncbi:MAG: cytochrome c [Acetobacteraceae bacterium]|nr:cytochrome c [Acetobacteraceae bacterium]
MSMLERALAGLGVLALATVPASAQMQADTRLGLGTPVTAQELSKFFAIPPDGRGLPPGQGTVAQGQAVFQESCAACHGERLEGNLQPGIGGDRLIGGRGTLASRSPVKTVESYWPYATTLFDYVKRAMPFNAPGSLTDDQVYSVVAYILNQAKIIDPNDVMDAKTLPAVRMPNRDGFIPDRRPELELYR